jgi:hypothetical protein
MPGADKDFTFFARWITSAEPSPTGEYRMWCPIHEDPDSSSTPSASINFSKGKFNCMSAKCIGGMSIRSLRKMVSDKEADDDAGVASYNPFEFAEDDGKGAKVIDIDSKRNKAAKSSDKPLTEGKVKAWHRGLMDNEEVRSKFRAKRGLTDETIVQYELGWDAGVNRITIPIRDEDGTLVNVRRYRMDAEPSQKMWNWIGCGSPPRLFPLAALAGDRVLVVEGELDAIICNQHGIPAVSGTGGAGRWDPSWSKAFAGKHTFLLYDNDRDGRIGAKKAQQSLRAHAATVRIIPPVMEEDKSDVTDFFLAGGTTAQLLAAIESAPPSNHDSEDVYTEEVNDVALIGSMDARHNGKPIAMTVTVTGNKWPTISIPHKVEMHCTMDAGPKCKACPMFTEHEGTYNLTVDPHDHEAIGRLVDVPEDKRLETMRKMIKAQRCSRLAMDVEVNQTLHELYVATNIDKQSIGRSEYLVRRAYVISNEPPEPNQVARLTGTTWPSPKDSRNEFYGWDYKETTTSIDDFQMTPELKAELAAFQVAPGQKPLEKCREIAHDLSRSVTRIVGRERMQICMDLVWHSVLQFEMEGKVMDRGWLEFLVVGDTRTGKSETALRLAEHYRLGHVIGCESATFAGLVGGVKQVGREWVVQWGEVTINDRRLVVMDEVSGLSQETISRMSDVRSRGEAQITAIETRKTKARCRGIWISNARKPKFVDERKTDGIDIVEDVIGNPEDIARFDFAMSVRSSDIANGVINTLREVQQPKYNSDMCHALVLWAWSRKPHHIQWVCDAYQRVYEAAEWIGSRYVINPPLLQVANAREKIARIAVAMAARTFSTDDTGEQVLVTKAHVEGAVNLLHRLYSYSNFGYYDRSRRALHNRQIAADKRAEVLEWLYENDKVLEFLLDRSGSFRAMDLEEMAFMDRHEVSQVLSYLSSCKMIAKDKSQIVLEPELQDILKGIRSKG